MIEETNVLKNIGTDIKDFLYGYIGAKSLTYTPGEKEAEYYLMDRLGKIPYFREHPEFYGTYGIEGDPFDRKVSYAMVRGTGNDTVVLIHHNDVVDVEDYKLLKPLAFSPDELGEELKKISGSLPEDARQDLASGDWLFGRGGCDMKGGGSIQFSLLERYSRLKDFRGNVIVTAVPDEENMSAGMRAAVKLLAELKEKYGLEYKMMINSEPHQRKDPETGVFSEGTVGKIMPFVYVRGYLSHIGKVYEGLNPVNLLSEIVRRTELNIDFSDVVGDECAPPPTWLCMKDSKTHYDVSMPISSYGCFSILTLNQRPSAVLSRVKKICEESFDAVIQDMNESYRRFCEAAKPRQQKASRSAAMPAKNPVLRPALPDPSRNSSTHASVIASRTKNRAVHASDENTYPSFLTHVLRKNSGTLSMRSWTDPCANSRLKRASEYEGSSLRARS